MNEHSQAIPQPVHAMKARLDAMIRRVRRLIVLRGLALVILTALAGLGLAMTIDAYGGIYSTWSRWGLALLTYGPAALIAVATLLRPLSQTFTPAGLARVIERRHPELHERISSAVELEAAQEALDPGGSQALIRALEAAAAMDIQRVDPRVEISIRKVLRMLFAMAAAVAVMAGIVIWRPDTAGRLALRSALPTLNLPNIHAGQLVVEPGDTVVAGGDVLRVTLSSLRTALPEAVLIQHREGGRQDPAMMHKLPDSPDARSRFALAIGPVTDAFAYRIRAGDAITREYRVDVVARPAVRQLDILYRYPDYTGREPLRTRVVSGNIRAVAGTEITVRALFNKPLEGVVMRLDGIRLEDRDGPVQWRHPEPDVAEFRLTLAAERQSTWSLEGVDEHGFRGGTPDYLLEAARDAVPVVTLTHPVEDRVTLRPTGRLPLHYTIVDDFGVNFAGMILEADGRPLTIEPIALPGHDGNRHVAGERVLDLSAYPLTGIRRLAVQLRAADRRPPLLGGPQVGKSRLLLIDLDDAARPYREQVLDRHTARLRTELEGVRDAMQASRQQIEAVDRDPAAAPDARTVRDSTRRALRAMESVEHALGVASETMQEGFYGGLRQPLAEEVGAPVLRTSEILTQLPVADDPETRDALVTDAVSELDRADVALQAMLEDLDGMHATLRHAVATDELAQRQRELAAALAAAPEPVESERVSPALAAALTETVPEKPEWPAVAPVRREGDEALAQARLAQADLVDELGALIRVLPEAADAAVHQTRGELAEAAEAAAQLRQAQAEAQARAAEAERQAEVWESAEAGLKAQLEALADAWRGLDLPSPPVPLTDIAADLEAGRLREAAAKLDRVATDLDDRLDRLEREQRTADLAEPIREVSAAMADLIPSVEHAVLQPEAEHERLADLLGQLAEIEQGVADVLPTAAEAWARHRPVKPLQDALAAEPHRARAEPLREAAARMSRLEQAWEAAARAAQAERLAERLDAVAREQDAFAGIQARAEALAERMESALVPWEAALERAAEDAAARQAHAQALQDALIPEVEALRGEMQQHPIVGAIPMPPPHAVHPDPAMVADQMRVAADQMRETLQTAHEKADTAVHRAREALDALIADAPDSDAAREARWRVEEAEEARERDMRRIEDGEIVAERLDRLAEAFEAVADERLEAEALAATVEADWHHVEDARALASQSEQRAAEAARERDRLAAAREQLEAQQADLLAASSDVPAADAQALARWEAERSAPTAARAMEQLAERAAEVARRQAELAERIAAAAPPGSQPDHGPDMWPAPVSPPSESVSAPQPTGEPAFSDWEQEQRGLAEEVRALKRQAAELSAGLPPRPMPQPERDMDRAARALEAETPWQALDAARQAAAGQAQLAEALADRASQLPPDPRTAMAETPFSPPPDHADWQTAVSEPDAPLPAVAPDASLPVAEPDFRDIVPDDDIPLPAIADVIPLPADIPRRTGDDGVMSPPPQPIPEDRPLPIGVGLTEDDIRLARSELDAMPVLPFGAEEPVSPLPQPDPAVGAAPGEPGSPMPVEGSAPASGDPSAPQAMAQAQSMSAGALSAQPSGSPGGEGARAGVQSNLDALQPASEAERLRQVASRLDPAMRDADVLPGDPEWRHARHLKSVPPETVADLRDHLQQAAKLAELLAGITLPRPVADVLKDAIAAGAAPESLIPDLEAQILMLQDLMDSAPRVLTDADPAPEQVALAAALQYAGRAAITGDPRAAERAALEMAETARVARERAESMGLSTSPRLPGSDLDVAPPEDTLRRFGVPVSDWLRLPGELRSEVLQSRPATGPEAYRSLIRRYFRDLARDEEVQ